MEKCGDFPIHAGHEKRSRSVAIQMAEGALEALLRCRCTHPLWLDTFGEDAWETGLGAAIHTLPEWTKKGCQL